MTTFRRALMTAGTVAATLTAAVAALAGCSTLPDPHLGGFAFTVEPVAVYQPRGQQGAFRIDVTRTGSFAGPVSLSLEDAPAGVTAAGVVGVGETVGELLIAVAPDAALGTTRLTVVGQSDASSGGPLAHRETIVIVILEQPEPAYDLSAADGRALPAVLHEETVTPDKGAPWTLQLVVLAGVLELGEGVYEHRILVDTYVDGTLSGRTSVVDAGTYTDTDGAIWLTSERIDGLAYAATRHTLGIDVDYDLYVLTGTHEAATLAYRR